MTDWPFYLYNRIYIILNPSCFLSYWLREMALVSWYWEAYFVGTVNHCLINTLTVIQTICNYRQHLDWGILLKDFSLTIMVLKLLCKQGMVVSSHGLLWKSFPITRVILFSLLLKGISIYHLQNCTAIFIFSKVVLCRVCFKMFTNAVYIFKRMML